jgi:ADP-ribosyl-[dinitrogen reductase] hydrolase
MRTSVLHPLQIAAVVSGISGHGRVGVTFCPGKYDPHGMSGAWNRDLSLDLDAIRDWGATAVVIATVPAELFTKFQTSFYADPVDAVFKALGLN